MGRDERSNPFGRTTDTGPGPHAVLDALGRVLQEGDAIYLHMPATPPIFRVASISPMLDPSAPPGLMRLQVGFLAEFVVQPTQPTKQVVRVATVAEAGPNPFTLHEPVGEAN